MMRLNLRKSSKSAIKSLTMKKDLFQHMENSIDEIQSEFDRVRDLCAKKKMEEAMSAFITLKAHLHAHMESVERSLHSFALGKSSADETLAPLADRIRESAEEHRFMNLLMNELAQLHFSDLRWKAKLTVLDAFFRQYLTREAKWRREWKKVLQDEDSHALLDRFLSVKNSTLRDSDLVGYMGSPMGFLIDRGILLAQH